MSIRFYDDAITKKINNWTKNAKILVTSPNETRRLFEVLADENNDSEIKLPLIAIRRNPSFDILHTQKRALTFNAATIARNDAKTIKLNAIDVSVSYQIDIYTRFFEECDEYVRNFIFNIINYPKLEVVIPYRDSNLVHVSNIRLSNSVDDNSDIPERLIPGQFTRQTLNIYVDDAYIFDVRVRDNISLEAIVNTESSK